MRCALGGGKEDDNGMSGSRDIDRFRLQSCLCDGLERSDWKTHWIDFSYLLVWVGHEKTTIMYVVSTRVRWIG